VRPTKTVTLEIDRSGEVTGEKLTRSVIRSDKRLSYPDCLGIISGDQGAREKAGAEVTLLLDDAYELAQALHRRRVERGALELDLPEMELVLDKRGELARLVPVEQDWSHRLIEEFMLAANEAVARHFTRKQLPLISRVHPPPEPDEISKFGFFARRLGLEHPKIADREDLSAVVRAVRGKPMSYAVNLALLKSLARAEYSPSAEGHWALATDQYCHFTSPIRRYPDLVVHQILDRDLAGGLARREKDEWMGRIGDYADLSSRLERRADAAEKELTEIKILRHLKDRAGEVMPGVITAILEFGMAVELESYLIEGFIHVSRLGEDFYEMDRGGFALVGRRRRRSFEIGDELDVRILGVDLDDRRLDLGLVDEDGGRRASKRA
jgi:ribonuclease R